MLYSALILGLLGSFHCVGMCGPIAFMLPVSKNNTAKKAVQISLYHLGRIIAYALMGFVFGWIGKGFYLFGLQQWLSIIIGSIMILAVILPQKIWGKHRILNPIYKIVSTIKTKLGLTFKKKSLDAFLTIGFLNGFLPCGLVYMGIFGAIAMASSLYSTLYMILFGIGTIPLMTMVIYLGKYLTTAVKQKIRQAIPVFVVILGLLFILRGLGLGIPYISPNNNVTASASASQSCH